jgi:membrane fusion protein (multidrug efflux system)
VKYPAHHYFCALYFCCLFFISCSNSNSIKTDTNSFESDSTQNQIIDIKVVVAQKNVFYNEISSNGRIYAQKKADLTFRGSEPLKKIFFKNGDKVKQGDIIATLDNFELASQLEQSKVSFSRAQLDLVDALIGQGYELKDSTIIPKNIIETAMLRSGYIQSKSALVMAEYNYNASILISPMNGIVANMFSTELNRPKQDPQFCTIIDNTLFQIEFPILETEITKVKKGQNIEVSPFFDTNIKLDGTIEVINPVVEENGMVRVYAEVRNTQNILCQGMNVKIFIKQKVDSQLVVPKNAITNRSDKDVIFTFSGGLAKWNYVTIGSENSEFYTITDGISVGDSVIVEGNTHLANLSKVRIAQKK